LSWSGCCCCGVVAVADAVADAIVAVVVSAVEFWLAAVAAMLDCLGTGVVLVAGLGAV